MPLSSSFVQLTVAYHMRDHVATLCTLPAPWYITWLAALPTLPKNSCFSFSMFWCARCLLDALDSRNGSCRHLMISIFSHLPSFLCLRRSLL